MNFHPDGEGPAYSCRIRATSYLRFESAATTDGIGVDGFDPGHAGCCDFWIHRHCVCGPQCGEDIATTTPTASRFRPEPMLNEHTSVEYAARGRRNLKTGLKVAMVGMFVLVLIFIVVAMTRNTAPISDEEFVRLMAQERIESAVNHGHLLNGCGDGDDANAVFTGTKNGILVTGIICPGVLKAHTVRYY